MIPPDVTARAVACVATGGVLIYPTETVYGLGGSAENETVITRVRRLKGRADQQPLLVLTDTWERAQPWIAEITPLHQTLMAQTPDWALTILFKPSRLVPEILYGNSPWVGIRCTSDPWCRALIAATDTLLVSTSANPTGQPAPGDFRALDPMLLQAVDVAVDAGHPLRGQPSTVVAVQGTDVHILREGAVSSEQLHALIG